MSQEITTAEAAGIIGCQDSRVRQLARAGTVKARRIGRDWLIDRGSAEQYAKQDRRPGRKPKDAEFHTEHAAATAACR